MVFQNIKPGLNPQKTPDTSSMVRIWEEHGRLIAAVHFTIMWTSPWCELLRLEYGVWHVKLHHFQHTVILYPLGHCYLLQHQASIWTNVSVLLIGPLGENFNAILIKL